MSDLLPSPSVAVPAVPAGVAAAELTPDDRSPAAWRAWVGPLAMLALVTVSLLLIRHELGGAGYHRVRDALANVPTAALRNAALLTVLAYVLLCGYDILAVRRVRPTQGLRGIAVASWLAYAISQTLGFPLLTGGAIRVRFWTAWGLSTSEIATATAFVSVTFMLGVLATSGLALLLEPSGLFVALRVPLTAARAVGVTMLAAVVIYIVWSWLRRGRALELWRMRIDVPPPSIAIAQLLLALLDWFVAALVLHALLPGSRPTTLAFAGTFALAQTVGVLSHVPGGVGVFESIMLLALRDSAPPSELLGALVAYRLIYYLIPFALGVLVLAGTELARHRDRVPGLLQVVGAAASTVVGASTRLALLLRPLLPTVLGISTFIGGALLLFSGATPAVHGRMRAITTALPLGLVELSHFAASIAGVGLMVLGAALRRRLDAAWGATVALLALGVGTALLRGLDWEAALVLTVLLLAVLSSRSAFYRPTALTGDVLTPGWLVALGGVIGASIWVGFLAYRHIDYTSQLWWQFATRGNAPRFLRASAGAVVAAFAVGAWRLLRPAYHAPALPDAAVVDEVRAIIRRVPESTPALALLGDKSLIFTDDRAAFVMYGISGRSWISMGDPVGPEDRLADAAWRFREAADAYGGWPVFYQVSPARLPLYIDLGLTLLKLGEEAVVPLEGFSVDGSDRKWMRRALKEGEKAKLRVEMVPADQVPPLLPELRRISDAWLGHKAAREKGFSLGRFDETYLCNFPTLVVREERDGDSRLVAFANIWTGEPGGEISPDLMRRSDDAPRGVMDLLFVELLRWGAAHGYRRANLGMTPLANLMDPALARPGLAPLWARAGTLVYGRGEAFYNFQGLRRFKEKFAPVWEPRYLASPGGIALPRVLTNVAALIAGGVSGILPR